MPCSGNCTIQEFEVRKKSYDDAMLDPPRQPGCAPSPPFADGQRAVFDAIDKETRLAENGCKPNCQCVRFAGQDPPWTERARATVETTYTQGRCSWKLKGSYEYRTRQFQGLCGPVSAVTAAAFIPDLGVTITTQTPIGGDQLGAIREILRSVVPGQLFTPQVDFGVTKIGEVFGPGRVEIAAYLDCGNLVAYVSEDRLDTVRALYGAEAKGSSLIIQSKHGPQKYSIKPLEALDYHQPINEGDGTVLEGWICRTRSPGECINIINTTTGAFLFSFIAPDSGVNICRRQAGDKCAVVWRTLTVDAFTERHCRGEQVTRTENFALCFPN